MAGSVYDKSEKLLQIKRMMGLKSYEKLPRCRAKCKRQARRLEAAGDPVHIDLDHPVCNDCQCTHVAGWGTKGFFWSTEPGWDNLGHYGVGYCVNHEVLCKPKAKAWEFARNHLKAMQQYGQALTIGTEYELMIREEAEEAHAAIEIRENIVELQEYLRNFRQLLEQDEQEELTEKCGKDVIKMTFATKAKLIKDLSLGVAQLAKDRFQLSQLDYVSVDQIKIRMPQMFTLASRCFDKLREAILKGDKSAVDNMKYEYKEEFKQIWRSLKPGLKS
jgi:hypothetical protein